MSKLDSLKASVGRNLEKMTPRESGLVKSFEDRLREETPAPVAESQPRQAAEPNVSQSEPKVRATKRSEKTGRIERLSVSMPSEDVARIQKVRKRAARRGDIYPKSHIVRAALIHMDSLEDSKVLEILESVAVIKPGKEAE